MENPLNGNMLVQVFLKALCSALFFLVYINDLVEGLVSDVRLFADDTSLFSVVYDEQVSTDILNADLKFIEVGIPVENAT